LATYLSKLVHSPEYAKSPILSEFLTPSAPLKQSSDDEFDLEDAVPSTLTRKAALQLKAEPEEPLPSTPEDPEPTPPTGPPVEPVPPVEDPLPTPPTEPPVEPVSPVEDPPTEPPVEPVPPVEDPVPTPPETGNPAPSVPETAATKIAAAYYAGDYDPFHRSLK
jgi:outer membrane biosynthesis protein TonB